MDNETTEIGKLIFNFFCFNITFILSLYIFFTVSENCRYVASDKVTLTL